jgi:hypothetical protein
MTVNVEFSPTESMHGTNGDRVPEATAGSSCDDEEHPVRATRTRAAAIRRIIVSPRKFLEL